MPEKDIIQERGRSLEEDYFRKKDKELIEKMRKAAATEDARAAMGQKTGITDPELLKELDALGFTPESVVLLPLIPALKMAWADRDVSAREREMIVKLARSRGIDEGSFADRTLANWLEARPVAAIFDNATRLIRAMLASSNQSDLTVDGLVKQAEAIAAASGGILGINRVSAEERHLLTALADELKAEL